MKKEERASEEKKTQEMQLKDTEESHLKKDDEISVTVEKCEEEHQNNDANRENITQSRNPDQTEV